jgi:hypothetical protein
MFFFWNAAVVRINFFFSGIRTKGCVLEDQLLSVHASENLIATLAYTRHR